MNPSDEEETSNGVTAKQEETQEAIEDLLEPKAIPDERIVRHAERNDSYREAPTIGNDEEIVQPPLELEVIEVKPKSTSLSANDSKSMEQEEVSPIQEIEEAQTSQVHEEAITKEEGVQLLTQDEILHSTDIPEASPVQVVGEERIPSIADIQPVVPTEAPIESAQVPLVTQTAPEPIVTESQGEAPVVYHTVSGGPETIKEKMTEHFQAVQAANPPTIDTTHSVITTSSGYTIPNPNYAGSPQVIAETESNIGFIFFLIILALIGGVFAYVYFFMPEAFDKFYDAVIIVVSELFKK